LWLDSTDQGLFRLKNSKDKNFIHYDLQNGLPSIHLSSLCADKAGNVVVVCQEGVAVFNLDADQFNWYQSNEGITSVDADLNTTSLAPDGSVWIGGKNEFIMMNTSLGKYRITPFLMLDGAKAMLEPFDISTYQNIQASKNHVSFSFNGIWFSNPSEVSFQYKLEGWNRDWVSTKDHSVNFANLDAGRYTFRLRCSRTGDFSRSKELNYQFAILNPLYLQWWFVLIVLGVLIILIWLFLRFRDRRMNILQKLEKEKIASQLETLKNQVNPHFLFNSFNTLANIIDEDKDKAVDYIERMTDFFRQILIHREKDLITLHEEMEIINDYVYLQKQRFNGALQTQISISESDAESHLIPPLVVQLLVENSIKHNALTSQKPLLIEIFFDGENFTVRNNLNPKLTREPSTGTGLQNISRRMEMLGLDEPEIIKNENYFIVKLKLPIKA
ncbi:MAG TPA: hypothetical protein DCQ93_08240, partial [Bacteroidetes bacterium]|nr:hypothetical protein [Bacteroidota bacterium]